MKVVGTLSRDSDGAAAQFGAAGGSGAVADPFASWRRVSVVMNGNNTSTVSVLGIVAPTASGTATNRALVTTSTTSNFGRMRRLGYVSATTAYSTCGLRFGSALFSRREGFRMTVRFGFAAINSQIQSFFLGMDGDTTATSIAGTEFVGITAAPYSTDKFNATVSTAGVGSSAYLTQIWNTSGVDVYDAIVVSDPADMSKISVTLKNLTTAFSENISLTNQLPNPDILLSPKVALTSGFSTPAVALDIFHIYVDTP